MIYKKKILCIIPARKGSSGLKNKNIKIINGKPLIYWPIKASINSKLIDKTLVSTDSLKIKKIAEKYGAKVPFLRPKKLSGNNSKISNTIIHALNYLEREKEKYEYLILLEPTSPLTNSKDVNRMLFKLFKNKHFESLITVSENITTHPAFNVKLTKNKLIQKAFKTSSDTLRQNISKLFYLSGNAYISKVDAYKKNKSFVHKKTLGYVMDKWKTSEIDDLVDFIKTEAILKYKKYK